MTEGDVRATIKALTGEQVDKELEAFNAFFNQFGLRFFDVYAINYYHALSEEAESRAKLQRYSEREKSE